MKIKRICVYCGANPGNKPEYGEAARQLGYLLADHKIELVYGGGKVGLMGIIANAVLEKGGLVTGIIPQKLVELEQAHQGLTDLRIVNDMHERKATMASLSDGFIALPGGFGTLEELFEVLTWSQIGYHQKPIALVNVLRFFDNLELFVTHATSTGLLRSEYSKFFQLKNSPEEALKAILSK
ncbi:TIGR00730 family Rossman fold protein [Bdellovibrio sp. HCB274]|uniref:LOG family protein n=1 Tax=Bdellovibrio sp. HCB274 TaxID=3394361 RepID=UPI0039B60C79